MLNEERRREELGALNIVALIMLLISLPWDLFVYKVDAGIIFWSMKVILFVLPYAVWWGTHRFGLGHWTQTLVVLSYQVFCLWHTIWIHPAYYIAFIETIVLSLLFWRPPTFQFYLQVICGTLGMAISLYFANEFPHTAPGKTARYDVAADSIIFMLNIAAYHWWVGRIQEKRRARELNFADLGMRSSYLLHEINRPLSQMTHQQDSIAARQSLDELRSLVDALDGVSRGHLATSEKVCAENVIAALRRRYSEYLADFDVKISVEGESRFDTHEGALELVLKNLFLNALEEAARLPPPRRWINIKLDLIDGVTISNPLSEPKKVKRFNIFDPGFTTKRGHQGMGLSLSRRLADVAKLKLESKVRGDEIIFTVSAQA